MWEVLVEQSVLHAPLTLLVEVLVDLGLVVLGAVGHPDPELVRRCGQLPVPASPLAVGLLLEDVHPVAEELPSSVAWCLASAFHAIDLKQNRCFKNLPKSKIQNPKWRTYRREAEDDPEVLEDAVVRSVEPTSFSRFFVNFFESFSNVTVFGRF